VDDLFAPPAATWQAVSPRLAVVRRAILGTFVAVALVATGVVAWLTPLSALVAAAVAVALLAVGGWGWWVVGRNARRWGYAETEDDLFITRGALFRRLVVVPYGRMQYVDVQAGPLDQAMGIAKVQLHTASPGTTAVIPGVPAEEAARLRDRLTARGESQAAGL
jgi:membrane protein YdbS with pleckstrin-like domain